MQGQGTQTSRHTGPVADPQTALGRRVDIQILRAIAVSVVVFYHYKISPFAGGFVGVDIFFVVSGYVVTGSLLKHIKQPMMTTIAEFYRRRILRILPALICMLFVTTIALGLFVPTELFGDIHRTAIAAALSIGNFMLLAQSVDYFAMAAEFNPFTHTWSLGIEEQFYVLMPFLLVFACKRFPDRSSQLRVFALILILLFGTAWLSYSYSTVFFYYTPLGRFWELLLGSFACLVVTTGRIRAARGRYCSNAWFLSGAVLLIAVSCVPVQPGQDSYLFWQIVVACAITFSLLLAPQPQFSSIPGRNSWLVRIPEQIGDASYSIYLWHWPIFVLLLWTVGVESATQKLIAIVLAAVFAFLSYRYVEETTRHRAVRLPLASAIGLSAVILFTGSVVLIRSTNDLYLGRDNSVATLWVAPSTPFLAGTSITPDNCHLSGKKLDSATLKLCSFGDPQTTRTIFLIGDSHGDAVKPMVLGAAKARGYSVVALTYSGCPIALSVVRAVPSIDKMCRDYVQDYLKFMREHAKPNDIVFISSRYRLYINDNRPIPITSQGDWTDHFLAEFDSTNGVVGKTIGPNIAAVRVAADLVEIATVFRTMQVTVVVESPIGEFPLPAAACSEWFNKYKSLCVEHRDYLDQHAGLVNGKLESLAARGDIALWDANAYLCEADECRQYDANGVTFRDTNHLSLYGNEKLLPYFSEFIGAPSAR